MLNISGDEYRIVEMFDNSMIIVNDNLFGGKCNLSGNYSHLWSPGSHFRINADTCTNLTLSGQCDRSNEDIMWPELPLHLCGDVWYYNITKPEDGADFCQTHLQVPINKNYLSPKWIVNQILLQQGFEVTWWVDHYRKQCCDSCSESGGRCGYNISAQFVCYSPDGTTYPAICPPNPQVRFLYAFYKFNYKVLFLNSMKYYINYKVQFSNSIRGPPHDPDDGHTDDRKPSASKGGRINRSAIVIGLSWGGVALIATAILLTFYHKKIKQSPPPPRSCISKVETFLKEYAYQMPIRYSQSELKKITNNFAEKLGEGGFGVVFKGKLRNGVLVAVKLLDRHRPSDSTEFVNEVATIGRVHHVNLVRLLGYCFESFTSALVYEFMANGSLEKFIFVGKEEGQILRWEQLYSIALGVARGIAYLHQDCEKRIIHFDIKPHNILLDAEFTPKVSDFGLAKLCGKEDDHISLTAIRGTPGYVAPEVCDRHIGPVTDKSDVYSFGMLLLEMVGGRKNLDVHVSRSSRLYFPEWAFKMLESEELGMRLGGGREGEIEGEDEERARTLTKVGLWCIQYNSRDRPCMSRVVQMLEGNGGDLSNPPLPFNSSAAPGKPLLSSTERSSSM
eukprot:PITA_02622